MSTDDVVKVLRVMPPRHRQYVLGALGLRHAATINRGMATQLLTRVRADVAATRCDLLRDLTVPVGAALDTGLEPDQWTTLLGEDHRSALKVWAENPELAANLVVLVSDLCSALVTAGLAAFIIGETAAAAVAMAVLAREDDSVREAYTHLLVTYPALPPIPDAQLVELIPSARLAALGVADAEVHVVGDELAELLDRMADDLDGETDEAHRAVTMDDGEQGTALGERDSMPPESDLLQRAEDFLGRWDDVCDAAVAIAANFTAGTLPAADELRHVTGYAAAGAAIAMDLRDALSENVDMTRDGLTAAASALARRRKAEADVSWLRSLTTLEGPDELLDAVTAVRESAAAAIEDPAASRERLAALWKLLELVSASRRGESVDYVALSHAQNAAQTAWSAMGPLITAMSFGAVSVPPGSPTSATEDSAAEVATAEQSDPGSCAHPSEAPAESGASGAPSADAAGAEANPADSTGGETTSDHSHEGDEQNHDLTDLDALLDSGAAATLAAVSGSRHRHSVSTASADSVDDITPAQDATAVPETAVPRILTATTSSDLANTATVAAALLSANRFGLAADLFEACGASAASVAARRLAAYATALTNPTGRLATAFAELVPAISRESLGEDRSGQLLALCAAARVALLAPSAGPATVLLDLLPCVSEQPALTDAFTALADASRAGIVVLAEAANAVGTLAAAEKAAEEVAHAAAELLSGATRRTIKYVPANVVYQTWMGSDGDLGELLTLVAANDADAVASVSDKVVALRGKAQKAIDATFAEQRRNRSIRIIAGARNALLTRWEEAVDLGARWVELVERAAERHAHMVGGAWQAGPLTRLRHRLAAVHEQALVELERQAHDDSAVATEIRGAVQLLTETFSICDGNAPNGNEPPVAYAAHRELLATELTLDADTLLPDDGLSNTHISELLRIADTGPVSPEDVYTHRARRGDHDLTAVLITGIRTSDPDVAAALERRRGADIATQAAEVADEVAELTTRIDTRRLAGTLDDQPWAALAARAEALKDVARRDFGRIRAAVTAVNDELDACIERKITATLARIDERAKEHKSVDKVADILKGLTRDGEVASAEEYLETLLTGGALPAPSHGVDHLTRFFPVLPEVATEHPNLLADLHTALSGGPPSPAVQRLAAAGLDLGAMSDTRRNAGRRALGAWAALRDQGSGTRKGDITSALQLVLAQMGLEFANAKLEQTPGRLWVRLTGVTGTGKALTPTLGSAMSPDGTTLRVLLVRNVLRTAPTPATLIEWMSGETRDHTVLALWFSGALSPADRRALADAARGRPNPPLLVLDSAALAYLVCQPEPRRSTFAATALPFTAASPYRDTPGDTPPEMFYGRTEELTAVLDLNGPSFVSGGRQLGKSALLRVAARRFEDSGPGRHAVLTSVFTVGGDGRPERLWAALWPHLARIGIVDATIPSGEVDIAEAVYDSVLKWLDAQPQRALLILLDEADAFLDADAAGARFTHVDWCRRLMWDSRRRAKVVFAGLHRTARFESLPNQPLSHLGRPISVGPLRPQHALDLLTEPLTALGFAFVVPALPARILAMANNMPALLQLFGEALVKHLTSQPFPADGPPQQITHADVDAVFADADLRAAFREKYVLTLNLDHRYLVITYTVAEAAHERGIDASLSLGELSDTARLHWPAGFSGIGVDDFRGLVTECVDLGMLAVDSGRYRLRTPTVLRLLGTEEEVLETLYTASERLVVPSASDGGSYRRRVQSARSPLTERQLGRLFNTRREVLVVAGSSALGIEAVLTAVEAAHDEGAHLIGAVSRVQTLTTEGVRAAVARAAAKTTLLLVDAHTLSSEALTTLLSTAEDAVAAAKPDVTVAVIASVGNAPAWVTRTNRIDLARVDEPGLRMWCDEDNLPFRDDRSRAGLLTMTGGWPQAVAHAGHLAAAAGPATGSSKLLADLEAWLAGSGGRKLAAGAGVGPDAPALAEVFRSTVNLAGAEGEDPHVLAELLEMDDRVGLEFLASESGFASLADVLSVLTALGCLTVTADGRVRPEPSLAALVTGTLPAEADA